MNKKQALAKFLECKVSEVEEVREYTDDIFKAEGERYFVLTDEEADEKAKEEIENSLWAFNADFIIGECGLDFSGVDSLKAMQEKSCENAQDFIKSLIDKTCGLDEFADSAISADGRGHFISSYDGEEAEQGGFFIYRID